MSECPLCGGEVYECDAEHVDDRRYFHCRQFSGHNFPDDEAAP